LYAPAFEAVGSFVLLPLWLVGVLPAADALLIVAAGILLSASVSLAAIFLDTLGFSHFRRLTDRARLVACAVLEHVGYRQFTVYYRLRAFYRYYRTIQIRSGWRPPARANVASR
jgi:hypothetical protein